MLAVPSYLLRIELEDRPGSLGSLAVALGSVAPTSCRWTSSSAAPGTRSTTWWSRCRRARCRIG
ncbi:hypothetical protein BZL30_0848 [Mycobacterium kansasii]|uniref:ACT domain protein n=1 Tax=Mycobacterium kansasii TaxID=1768 RepID=A0A1V3XTX7_MYCKA|nr:hypothetical protein BZL30_0848 [Mycobacterium kansasii]